MENSNTTDKTTQKCPWKSYTLLGKAEPLSAEITLFTCIRLEMWAEHNKSFNSKFLH